jgi:hypothetical protein
MSCAALNAPLVTKPVRYTGACRTLPRIAKYGINLNIGVPGTVAGLLDPHPDASGGLASSLGE